MYNAITKLLWLKFKLQSSSIKVLCQNLISVASSPTLKREAEAVSETFSQAFELFAKCHKGYNANVVTDSAIKQTGEEPTQIVTLLIINDHKNSQNKTLSPSWTTIDARFLMPPSCRKCTSWKTTSSHGWSDGTLELDLWGSKGPSQFMLTS